MGKNWVYVGIFLDESSKEELNKLYTIPSGWKECFDHITIVYNDNTKFAEDVKNACSYLGESKIRIKVLSQGMSDKAYALQLKIPAGIPCGNKTFNVAIATSPIGKTIDINDIDDWIDISDKKLDVFGVIKTYINKNKATQ